MVKLNEYLILRISCIEKKNNCYRDEQGRGQKEGWEQNWEHRWWVMCTSEEYWALHD